MILSANRSHFRPDHALGIVPPARYGAAQSQKAQTTGRIMAERIVPHFHNQSGAAVIEIGAHEFMCIGALPPFDHPHIFLDMGDESEIVCSYCSTLYRLDPALDPHAARPEECAWREAATA
jgi:uncharacterized Zn-finger protein